MLILLVFAFLAGVVTILSPCILPILPIVLSSSVTGGKRRPLGVVTGFIISFTFFTLFLASLVKATGLSADALRAVSVVVIAGFGASLLIPQTQAWLEKLLSNLSRFSPRSTGQEGFVGGMVIGLSLGLVWAPCVGPILASVITLAITSQVSWAAVLITFTYSLGTALPMLAITYTGRSLFQRVPWLLSRTALVQKIFGVIMILTAAGIYFNFDRQFQQYILQVFPQYGAGLTSLEDNQVVNQQLAKLKQQPPMLPPPAEKKVVAPELIGGGKWLNSAPLTLAELKGKVVLIDFWTYSCINCIRTLPYLRDWHSKYQDKGLVIIGVHSPEFEFEKSTANVQKAVNDFQITYPVVQDNDFAIWQAYGNRYWPAKYLIDAQGNIRYAHFGEGKYQETEQKIQALLEEAGAEVAITVSPKVEPDRAQQQTPETYLGYERTEGFVNASQFKPDEIVDYTLSSLHISGWGLSGPWKMTKQHLIASGDDSVLRLAFVAKEVYVVMGSDQPQQIKVLVDGEVKFQGEDVDSTGVVQVQEYKLYRLFKADNSSTARELILHVPPGVRLFAFTFGS